MPRSRRLPFTDSIAPDPANQAGRPRALDCNQHSRRLSDKVLAAFNAACDQAEWEAAERLARLLEFMVKRRAPLHPLDRIDTRRIRDREIVVSSYAWLWIL